jgi:membrane protease YdiL (CAAX protease family)
LLVSIPLSWRKAILLVGFSLLALALIGLIGIIWGALIYVNLRKGASYPWSLPVIMVVLWLMWQYLGGRGGPQSNRKKRKTLLRANWVSRRAFVWSFFTGILAVAALAGIWVVFGQIFRMPPNLLLPANFTSTPLLVGGIILGASLVAPITEESAIRGYLQVTLEREFHPLIAVFLSSVIFALAHVSQGLSAPKLFIYFLVGLTFGTLACLNDSILPVIPVHIMADLVFFIFIWPGDSTRKTVSEVGMDSWFWLHVIQAFVFTGLTLLSFRHLQRVTKSARNSE